MAFLAPTSGSISLAAGEDLFVAPQVYLYSGSETVFAVGDSHILLIRGTVAGSTNTMVLNGNGNQVTITDTGLVQGLEGWLMLFLGDNNSIDNAGIIDMTGHPGSVGPLVFINQDTADSVTRFTNSGLFHGYFGFDIRQGDGLVEIDNSGRMDAVSLVGVDRTSNHVVHFINTGTASGYISFGNGDDLFDSTAGTFHGDIYAGAGNDWIGLGNGGVTVLGEEGNDTLVGSAETDQFYGGAGKDRLNGKLGSDVLLGEAGKDTLIGGAGNDRLTGGGGQDALTGGAGNDRFIYTFKNQGGDIITDFSPTGSGNNDSFNFKGTAFGGHAKGSLATAEFQSSNAAVAHTADVRFFYEADTGILRFDDDGNGAHAAIVIATLQSGATMTINDILII